MYVPQRKTSNQPILGKDNCYANFLSRFCASKSVPSHRSPTLTSFRRSFLLHAVPHIIDIVSTELDKDLTMTPPRHESLPTPNPSKRSRRENRDGSSRQTSSAEIQPAPRRSQQPSATSDRRSPLTPPAGTIQDGSVGSHRLSDRDSTVEDTPVTFDDSGLRTFLASRDKVVMEKFVEHMAGLHKVVADLRSDVGDVKNELGIVKSQVDILALKDNVRGVTSGTGPRVRVDPASRCDGYLHHFDLIFCNDIIVQVLTASILRKLTFECSKCDEHLGNMGNCTFLCVGISSSQCIAALLFGKRANMVKAVLHTGVGKEYSRLRRFLVLSLLRNAQSNRFKQFHIPCIESASVVGQATVGVSSLNERHNMPGNNSFAVPHTGRIPQPPWIMPNFVKSEHVEKVRNRLETKKEKSRSGLPKKRCSDDRPTDDEISQRCVDLLYGKVTPQLHAGRDRSRTQFFSDIGYVLFPWTENSAVCELHTPTLKLTWAYPGTTSTVSKIAEVPITQTRTGEISPEVSDNSTILGNFLKKAQDMIVIIEHGVSVRQDDGNGYDEVSDEAFASSDAHGDIMPLKKTSVRRVVNLVEIALRFLHAYCGGVLDVSISHIMGSNSEVLRAAFAVAATYKGIVQRFMDEMSRSDNDLYTTPAACRTVRYEDVTVADFLPTPSIQHKTLQKMVFAMSSVDYEVHNVPARQGEWGNQPHSSGPDFAIDAHSPMGDDGNGSDGIEGLDYVLV